LEDHGELLGCLLAVIMDASVSAAFVIRLTATLLRVSLARGDRGRLTRWN
jgi:hypothetical protein